MSVFVLCPCLQGSSSHQYYCESFAWEAELIFETSVDFEYEFPPKRIRRHPPIFFEFFHLILNAFFPMYPTLFFGILFLAEFCSAHFFTAFLTLCLIWQIGKIGCGIRAGWFNKLKKKFASAPFKLTPPPARKNTGTKGICPSRFVLGC